MSGQTFEDLFADAAQVANTTATPLPQKATSFEDLFSEALQTANATPTLNFTAAPPEPETPELSPPGRSSVRNRNRNFNTTGGAFGTGLGVTPNTHAGHRHNRLPPPPVPDTPNLAPDVSGYQESTRIGPQLLSVSEGDVDFEGNEGKFTAPYDAGLNRYTNLNPQDAGRLSEYYEEHPPEAQDVPTGADLPPAPKDALSSLTLDLFDSLPSEVQESAIDSYVNKMDDEAYSRFYNAGKRLMEMQKGAADTKVFISALSPEEQIALRAAASRNRQGNEVVRTALEGAGRAVPFSNVVVPSTAAERRRQQDHPIASTAGSLGGNIGMTFAAMGPTAKALSMIPRLKNTKLGLSAATRVGTQAELSIGRDVGRKETDGKMVSLKEILANAGIAGIGGGVSMIPEIYAPPGIWQAIAQPGVDFGFDALIAKAQGQEMDANWWINEIGALGVSGAFGIRDAASGKTFMATQKGHRGEIKSVGSKFNTWLHGVRRTAKQTGEQPRLELFDPMYENAYLKHEPHTYSEQSEHPYAEYNDQENLQSVGLGARPGPGRRPGFGALQDKEQMQNRQRRAEFIPDNAEQNALIGRQKERYDEDESVIAEREDWGREQEAEIERMREQENGTDDPGDPIQQVERTMEALRDLKTMLSGKRNTMTLEDAKALERDIAERGRALTKTHENTRVEAPESKVEEVSTPREERSPDEAGRAQEGAETHSPEIVKTIEEYNASTDEDLVHFAQRVRDSEVKRPSLHDYSLGEVTDRAVADVGDLMGTDIAGYTHNINGDAVEHIEIRHGEKGQADKSMADINDYGRIKYVLDNYDSVDMLTDKSGDAKRSRKYNNADNTKAPLIIYKKRINGNFYVVEAVPDSKARRLQVVSAYKSDAETGGGQVLNMATKTPQRTPEAPHAATSDTNKIPNPAPEVKKKIKNLSEPSADPIPEDAEALRAAERDAASDSEREPTLKESTLKGFSSDKEAREASERAAPGDLNDIGVRKGQKGHYHQFQFGDRIFGLRKDSADAAHGTVYEQDASGRGVPLGKDRTAKVTLEEAKQIIAQHLRDTPEQTHKFSHNPAPDYSSIDPASPGKGGSVDGDNFAVGTFDIELSSGTNYSFPTKSGLTKIQLPEMVKIAKEVLGGKLPAIKNFLKKKTLGLVYRDEDGKPHINLQKNIFKDPELAARVLAHEIGHADHETVGGDLGEIISNMRNALDDGLTDGRGAPPNLDLKKIRDELWALSKKWRPLSDKPTPGELRYRKKPEELHADAVSVLLNDPDLLQREAPTAFNAIMGLIKNKTAFAEAYGKMMDMYGRGEDALVDSNIKESEEGYDRMTANSQKQREEAESLKRLGLAGNVKKAETEAIKAFVDKFRDIHDAENLLVKAGIIKDAAKLAYYKFRSIGHVGGQQEAYTFDIERGLTKALHGDEGKLNADDIRHVGLYMEYNRIAHGDRQDIANPRGITKERAEKVLARLKNRWGEERFEAVKQAAEAVADVRGKHIIPVLEKSGLLTPALKKKMNENRHYATFNVVKELYDTHGHGIMEGIVGVKAQIGTFKDIGNPLQATYLNDLMLLHMAARNDAIRTAVGNLRGNENVTGIKVEKAELDSDDRIKYLPSTVRDMQTVVYFENGKKVGYNMSKGVAMAITENPHYGSTALAWLREVNKIQRELLTTKRLKFHVRNPIRDFKETHLNLRGNVLYKVGKILEAGKEVWKAKTGGEMSDDLQELLMNRGALTGISLKNESSLGYDKAFEDRLKQFGTNDQARDMWLKRYYRKASNVFDAWLSFEERTMKLAGHKIVKEMYPELSKAEQMHLVRTMAGTSDISSGGTLTPWTNNLFLYSNSTLQGWYGSAEAFKRDWKSYTVKQLIYNIVPKTVAALAEQHYISQWLDDAGANEWVVNKYFALEKSLNAIPGYYKARYDAVPLPIRTKDGRQYFLPAPKSFEEQYIGESLYYGLDGFINGDGENTATTVMNTIGKTFGAAYAANPASGGLTPILKSALGIGGYFLGMNPYDPFYGRQVIPKGQYRKDFGEDMKTLGKWAYKNIGGELFWIIPKQDDIPDEDKAPIQKMYGLPIIGDPLTAILRVTDEPVPKETYREWRAAAKAKSQK